MKKSFVVQLEQNIKRIIESLEELNLVAAAWKREGLNDAQRLFLAQSYSQIIRTLIDRRCLEYPINDLLQDVTITNELVLELFQKSPIFTKGSVFLKDRSLCHVIKVVKEQIPKTLIVDHIGFSVEVEEIRQWTEDSLTYNKSVVRFRLTDLHLLKVATTEEAKEIKKLFKAQRKHCKSVAKSIEIMREKNYIDQIYTVDQFVNED